MSQYFVARTEMKRGLKCFLEMNIECSFISYLLSSEMGNLNAMKDLIFLLENFGDSLPKIKFPSQYIDGDL